MFFSLTSSRSHHACRALEAGAMVAIERGQGDFADYLLLRVAELREAAS
jgi:hypothetical protein